MYECMKVCIYMCLQFVQRVDYGDQLLCKNIHRYRYMDMYVWICMYGTVYVNVCLNIYICARMNVYTYNLQIGAHICVCKETYMRINI
jgi:hypothetical protein